MHHTLGYIAFMTPQWTLTNDWNAKIKCTNFYNLKDKPTFYYLGRYPRQLYFNRIYSLNRPMIFLRKDQEEWNVVAIGACYPCTATNHHLPNGVVTPANNGATKLRVYKAIEFQPTWSLFYMSKNLSYFFGHSKVYEIQKKLTFSDSIEMSSLFISDQSSSVRIDDSRAMLRRSPTSDGVEVNSRWMIYDDYYVASLSVSKYYSWRRFVEEFFPEQIPYPYHDANVIIPIPGSIKLAPAKDMKALLMKVIDETSVSPKSKLMPEQSLLKNP